jgi:hypothetical protein
MSNTHAAKTLVIEREASGLVEPNRRERVIYLGRLG